MTSKERARELTFLNLVAIFGEVDPSTRIKRIQELWVASGECFFADPSGVYKTHQELSDMVASIQAKGSKDDRFFEIRDSSKPDQEQTEFLAHDEMTDTWVTKVKWGVGPSDDKPTLTGLDVLTIVGGRIKACYTFLDPPKGV